MERLSAIIITKNEEGCIGPCLESVKWADQIVVVDSGSSDRTMDICREYTDCVIYNEWPGSNRQKNFALSHAVNPWILCIDADEAVSPKLRQSIEKAIASDPPYAGYKMLRRNYYRDTPFEFGAFYPKPELRLFRRDKGKFIDRLVHDKVILDGKCGKLDGYLEHYNITDLAEWIEKNVRYAALSAQGDLSKGRRVTLWDFISPFGHFLRRYIFRKGFLHGIPGLVFSLLPACFRVLTCAMVWDGQEKARREKRGATS
jgi:glycosyltransferase involved in cell wall biosynthesis